MDLYCGFLRTLNDQMTFKNLSKFQTLHVKTSWLNYFVQYFFAHVDDIYFNSS